MANAYPVLGNEYWPFVKNMNTLICRRALAQCHLLWSFATTQLACVGRCSPPDRRLGKALATTQLVCVEQCFLRGVRQTTEYRSLRTSRAVTVPDSHYALVMNMAQPRQAWLWPHVDVGELRRSWGGCPIPRPGRRSEVLRLQLRFEVLRLQLRSEVLRLQLRSEVLRLQLRSEVLRLQLRSEVLRLQLRLVWDSSYGLKSCDSSYGLKSCDSSYGLKSCDSSYGSEVLRLQLRFEVLRLQLRSEVLRLQLRSEVLRLQLRFEVLRLQLRSEVLRLQLRLEVLRLRIRSEVVSRNRPWVADILHLLVRRPTVFRRQTICAGAGRISSLRRQFQCDGRRDRNQPCHESAVMGMDGRQHSLV